MADSAIVTGSQPHCGHASLVGSIVEGGLPSEAHVRMTLAHRRACGAMVGILRLHHERRMVDLAGERWNQLDVWLRRLDGLRTAA